jgi:hypothetical protein
MTRKLNPEQASAFEDALQGTQCPPPETNDQLVNEKLSAQRDAVLVLSPELRLWFGVEQPVRLDY